jgi:hypothetical protein
MNNEPKTNWMNIIPKNNEPSSQVFAPPKAWEFYLLKAPPNIPEECDTCGSLHDTN